MINSTDIRAFQKKRVLEVTSCLGRLDHLDGAVHPGVCRPLVIELKTVLASLGMGFALFGRYVSSRVDLLPASDCVVLSDIADTSIPISYETIRERFGAEIGRPIEEAFLSIVGEPFESRVLYQAHRVVLHSGQDAVLKVLHANSAELLAVDVELLNRLESVLVQLGWTSDLFLSTLTHFEGELKREMDFVCLAQALQLFKDEVKSDAYQVATVRTATSSKSFLTVTLHPDHLLSKVVEGLEAAEPGAMSIEQRREAGQALCVGWLRQVFEGGLYPVSPYFENLSLQPSSPVVIGGGQFSRLSQAVRENLWDYITSVARHDPDRACTSLLTGMPGGVSSAKVLKHLFRQVVPFRDGGWTHLGHLDSLPEHVFIQWQMATRQGCRPSLELVEFFRGMFLTAFAAHRLIPDEDAFGLALQSYQAQRDKDRFRDTFDVGKWSDAMDKYAATVSTFPQKLDEFLTRASRGDLKIKFRLREADEHRQARNTSSLGIALALLLVSLVLIVDHLSNSVIDPIWLERIGSGAFVLVGGLLLWVLNRSKA